MPTPSHLCFRIRNSSAIPLRAAYLHGPFTIHVAAYPSVFNPNTKLQNPKRDGTPQFEPNLKAGSAFTARLTVPDDIRISSSDDEGAVAAGRSVTWIIEIASQILFSASASVKFELLVGRDERSLDYNFSVVGVGRGQETGQVHDRQEGRRRRGTTGQTKGVYSKSVTLAIDDTDSLWDRPALPTWDGKASDKGRRKSAEPKRAPGGKKKKIHLVILTHGLHSNVGADMLYLKESIDATAKAAREKARSRRRAASSGRGVISPRPPNSFNCSAKRRTGGHWYSGRLGRRRSRRKRFHGECGADRERHSISWEATG